ncbi:MAG: cobalamin-binding protein [Saprospiraceae bacterium]
MTSNYYPERILCLTEETTETLYLLGEEDRIIGISGFTVRPKRARKEKPIVSTFIDAKIEVILDLKPDLVIGFSDIQADIAQELIARGITVWINNYRSVAEIYKMMFQLGSLVGKADRARELIEGYRQTIQSSCAANRAAAVKPRVYFEEWGDPLITGIQWVSELVELAGGIDIFRDLKDTSLAKNRIIADPGTVIERNPDIIIGSWCGKKFRPERVTARAGWDKISAVQNGELHEINSSIILQPGPAAVTEGIAALAKIIGDWQAKQ